jgi:hypothetical protein
VVVTEFKIKFLEESWQADEYREGHPMITVLKEIYNNSVWDPLSSFLCCYVSWGVQAFMLVPYLNLET